MAAELLPTEQIILNLEPTLEREYTRHLNVAKEWFPHEVIPWSRAEDFKPGELWTPEDSGIRITDAVRRALIVNLLTEDNLPHYFKKIDSTFDSESLWGTWAKRWTSEEGRHSMAIYGYLMATRAIDPVQYERDRMAQVSKGEVPDPDDPVDALVYVALQELATRVAHWNTGKAIRANGDEAGYEVMKRVAADENLHHIFYRNLVTGVIDIDPSSAIMAIARQIRGFKMPGTGIRDFKNHEDKIARGGIFGVTETVEEVMKPTLLQWKIESIPDTDLTDDAKRARKRISSRIKVLEKFAVDEADAREEYQDELAA